ncbi:hypothetical protein CVU75_01670 [Candidatus Dependentiae bacterium HGW-Dependentiae-1]|nr:MAG: hypothetical protein CVU75_01670 [Candidatus Dependentiae bacterium HGW-Dependentiae-1]
MFNMLHALTDKQKGILLIVIGSILFFHTVGILQAGLNYIIIVGSLLMIIYGFMLVNIHKKVMAYINKRKEMQ